MFFLSEFWQQFPQSRDSPSKAKLRFWFIMLVLAITAFLFRTSFSFWKIYTFFFFTDISISIRINLDRKVLVKDSVYTVPCSKENPRFFCQYNTQGDAIAGFGFFSVTPNDLCLHYEDRIRMTGLWHYIRNAISFLFLKPTSIKC